MSKENAESATGEDSAVKSTGCSHRRLRVSFQNPTNSLQPTITPVPGVSAPFPDLHSHYVHVVHMHTLRYTHT